MRTVALGTAHLFGKVPDEQSSLLLDLAWRSGVRRFDTAPSYGGGRSEVKVGELVKGQAGAVVTTKVGLEPVAPPVGTRGRLKRAAGRLPGPVKQRLRRAARHGAGGRFGVEEVRNSVERSLGRLGRLDRLLLHEVQPGDVTPELLELLAGYLQRGDVGRIGVATQNDVTAEALARGGEMFTVGHVEAGPLSTAVDWPEHVQVRVGHGLLGPAGAQLRALQRALANPSAGAAWGGATRGTPWAGSDGLALALLARPCGVDEVIVATGRASSLLASLSAAAQRTPLPPVVGVVLDELVSAVRSA